MAISKAQFERLKTETLLAKYAGWTDQAVADDLNAAVIDNWVPITSADVYQAMDDGEFQVLTAADKAEVDRILGLGGEIVTAPGSKVRTKLVSVFGGGSNTSANIGALANQKISWATREGFPPIQARWIEEVRA